MVSVRPSTYCRCCRVIVRVMDPPNVLGLLSGLGKMLPDHSYCHMARTAAIGSHRRRAGRGTNGVIETGAPLKGHQDGSTGAGPVQYPRPLHGLARPLGPTRRLLGPTKAHHARR